MTELDQWWSKGHHESLSRGDHRYDLFVRDEGQGPVLLLMHGFPASSFEWAAVWPLLTEHHRVIAPDFLGFGASDKPRGHRYRVTEQADLVEALLAQIGVSTPTIVCYDYGAIVAQELLARAFPIRRVIFANAGVFPHLYRPKLIQKVAITPLLGPLISAAAVNRRTFERTWGKVFSQDHPLSSRAAADHFRAARTGARTRFLQSRLLAYIPERAAMAERLQEALVDNIHRSSFLWGMLDPVSGSPIAHELRRRFPGVDLVTYPNGGHCPHLEIPERVAADVLARTGHTYGSC